MNRRIGLAITLLLSYPLLIIPLRITIVSLIDVFQRADLAQRKKSHEESNLTLRIGLVSYTTSVCVCVYERKPIDAVQSSAIQ